MEAQNKAFSVPSDAHEHTDSIAARVFSNEWHPIMSRSAISPLSKHNIQPWLDRECTANTLEGWKADLLRAWFENKVRAVDEQDVICFSTVFDTSAGPIKALLNQLREEKYSLHALRASKTSATESGRTDQQSYDADSNVSMNSNVFNSCFSTSEPSSWNLNESSTVPNYIDGYNSMPPVTYSMITTPIPLLKCIEEDISARKKRGCGRIDRSILQRGDVPCTLGCGRMFRSACDRNRHEETVFPQRYWVCHECMDLDDPSRKDLFIRLDKIQGHSIKYHSGQLRMDICKVTDLKTALPKACGLCPYHYRSPNDRLNHIATRHSGCRKKDRLVSSVPNFSGGRLQYDESSQTDPEASVSFSSLHTNTTTHNDDRKSTVVGCGNRWRDERVSAPIFPGCPIPDNISVVRFHPLAASTATNSSIPDSRLLAVQWSDKVHGEGASGQIWKVQTAIEPQWGNSLAEPREFACKMMLSHEAFKQEVKAFEQLSHIRPKPAIVECFGTFEHLDSQGRLTHNLLLEHAQGDLWQYWSKTLPPNTNADIFRFYSQLFNLSAALKSIHGVGHQEDGRAAMRHGDLKPENILYYDENPSLSIFKIADLGLAKIQHKLSSGGRYMYAECEGLTPMYSAPELDARSKATGPVWALQRTDIWSFGCVLSLAASWIVKSFSGIQGFETRRMVALHHAQRLLNGCFHDGTSVLPEVLQWHDNLRRCIRSKDKITTPLLDLVDKRLLQADQSLRPSANELHDYLMQILQHAEADSQVDLSGAEEHIGIDFGTYGDSLATPGFAMETFKTPCEFRDSAIGMEASEASEFPILDNEVLSQWHKNSI